MQEHFPDKAIDVRKKSATFNVDLLLFFLIMITYGYFHGTGGWNQISRFDAMLAFVEPYTVETGTFRIDRFMTDPEHNINTGDWSYYHGHYYSNKAPGTILLGTAIYFALFHLEQLLGIDPDQWRALTANFYLINLLLSGLMGALAITAFRRFLMRLGSSQRLALGLSLTLALTTMLFPYSTQLWGHPTAAYFMLFALYCLTSHRPQAIFLSGLFTGMAVFMDYLAAVIVVALAILIMLKYRTSVVWYLSGGVIPAIIIMLYHKACFGSYLALATDYGNAEFLEENKILGMFAVVGLQNLKTACKLLFSLQRGLIVQMPVLLFSLIGMIYWFRKNRRDPLLWASVFSMTALIMVNAAFNGWHGGASVAPRYQIVALPFWILCIRELPWNRITRSLFIPAAVWSGINMLVLAIVTPLIHPFNQHFNSNPLYGWAYTTMVSTHMATVNTFRFDINNIKTWSTCSLGGLLGLHGLSSLIPLFAVGSALIFLIFTTVGKEGENNRTSAATGEENEKCP